MVIIISKPAVNEICYGNGIAEFSGFNKVGNFLYVYSLVFFSEWICKSKLRNPSLQWHLTTFEPGFHFATTSRFLPVMSTAGLFAHARTLASANALSLFMRIRCF